MANIKEKELPVADNIDSADYLRMVSSEGISQIVSARVLYDGLVELNTSAASGTTDGDLYAAIVALGWENDVIE